ncbi:MAG: hypothetical protein SGILL_006592, partial [Bacillariaceae sp.]
SNGSCTVVTEDSSSSPEGGVVSHHPQQRQQQHSTNNSSYCNNIHQRDQLRLEDLRDVLQVLKSQELLYSASEKKSPPLFVDTWRPVMVSWMYSVIDTFLLNPICVPTALYFLDTCSALLEESEASHKAKQLYPLMALTALNLGVKCHETRMFPLDQLVQLMGSGGSKQQTQNNATTSTRYTPDDVIRMETTLLKGCQWKLHPATPHDFLHQFVTVLDDSLNNNTKQNVLERGLLHLKNASMWEHVLLQQQQAQQQLPACTSSFLPSTLAYASLLLAMEDLQVALEDKQACCLALLQVADLSTHTPRLSAAYNWLVYAQQLQQQLVHSQQQQRQPQQPTVVGQPVTPTVAKAASDVVSPSTTATTTATVSAGQQQHQQQLATKADFCVPASKADFQPPRGGGAVAIVSPTKSTCTMDTAATSGVNMETATSVSVKKLQREDDDSAEGNDYDDDLEVIFYSHTYMGDGFEVMAVVDDNNMEQCKYEEDYEACERQMEAADSFSLTSPFTCEDAPPELILTESLDEDGFEVSFHIANGMEKNLSNMLASPRDVVTA